MRFLRRLIGAQTSECDCSTITIQSTIELVTIAKPTATLFPSSLEVVIMLPALLVTWVCSVKPLRIPGNRDQLNGGGCAGPAKSSCLPACVLFVGGSTNRTDSSSGAPEL